MYETGAKAVLESVLRENPMTSDQANRARSGPQDNTLRGKARGFPR